MSEGMNHFGADCRQELLRMFYQQTAANMRLVESWATSSAPPEALDCDPFLLWQIGQRVKKTAFDAPREAADRIKQLAPWVAAHLHPALADAMSDVGWSLLWVNQVDLALDLFGMARAIDPSPDHEANAGKALLWAGRFPEGERLTTAAFAAAPDRPAVHMAWGMALCCAGRFDEACEILGSKRPVNVNSGYALPMIGIASLAADRFDQARAAFSTAIQFGITSATAWLPLIDARQGRTREALTQINGLEITPDSPNPSAVYNRAICLAEAGYPDEAMKQYLYARRIHGGLEACYRRLQPYGAASFTRVGLVLPPIPQVGA
jgi:tetratricopeptide (TPR) repeat protein